MIILKVAFVSPASVIHENYRKKDLLGIEYQIFGLAKELINKGYETYILRRWYTKPENEVIEGINIINIASPNIPGNIFMDTLTKLIFSKYAAKKIKKLKPEIVVLNTKFSAYGVYKTNISAARIFITHSLPRELMPGLSNFPVRQLHPSEIIEKIIYKKSNVIISLNNFIKSYLRKKGYTSIYIPNGVAIEQYIPKYHGEGYIFYSGRLVSVKCINCLIKAYSLLSKKLKKAFKLIIQGEGPEIENLKKLTITLGIKNYVIFRRWASYPEFISKMANADIFVLPSIAECMPVTLLEAMALGKAVIGSNIPGINDIIKHGYNGYLFEKGNAYELKNYLELLLENEDLRKKVGLNARKTIERKFSFKIISKKYSRLFTSLVRSLKE